MSAEIIQAIALGAVQGVSEFLPISSTGHLILVPALLGWTDPLLTSLEFTVALHAGTLLALLLVFWRDWLHLARAALRSLARRSLAEPDARLAWLVALATLPAGLAGLLAEPLVKAQLRSALVVGVLMVLVALVLAVADRRSARSRDERTLGPIGALTIGIAQALALAPGVSRSGITIAAGLGIGLSRAAAARFSFLLSAPIIAGADAREAVALARSGLPPAEAPVYLAGVLSAALAGYLAIRWLLAYLASRSLLPFVVYRLTVGGVVVLLALAGRL